MLVYHGSNLEVSGPVLLPQNRFLDFGPGFYTTTNKGQAIGFSHKVVRREGCGIATVSVYETDEAELANTLDVLRFKSPDGLWLDFVAAHRSGTAEANSHDVVIGPVADDDVYATVTLYLNGVLTREQAIEALKVKKLFDQFVWKTAAALGALEFVDSFEARKLP